METNNGYTVNQFIKDVKSHFNFIKAEYSPENDFVRFKIIGYYFVNEGALDFEREISSEEDKEYMKELQEHIGRSRCEKIMVQKQVPLYEIIKMKFAEELLAKEISRSMVKAFWGCEKELEKKYQVTLELYKTMGSTF